MSVMAGTYRNSWYIFCKYCLSILPDSLFHNTVSLIMHKRFKCKYRWMKIKNPKTFSEKLQYLKIHPVCTNEQELADKYDVRDYVSRIIGNKYLIPIIGIYSSVQEIEYDKLPEQFVLKLTKGSGYNLIVQNKSSLDISKTNKMLSRWLKINPYYFSREPQYKGKNRLICEQMLEYNITDYKFFCFNGIPEYVELFIDRFGNHRKVFYDMSWKRMPFNTAGDKVDIEIDKPAAFDEMRMVAEKLSAGIKFVRVDLYVHDGKVYFGELTFHPAGGYTPISPMEWDRILGDKIII